MLTRRKFLIGLGVIGAIGTLGGFNALFSATALPDLVEKIVLKYTKDLNVSVDVVKAFSSDFSSHSVNGPRNKLLVYFFKNIYLSNSIVKTISIKTMSEKTLDEIRQFERGVITAFVLSTNIPSMKDIRQESVRYFGYSQDVLCNPFARFL